MIVSILLSLGGCSSAWLPFKAYEGPELVASDVAVIRSEIAMGALEDCAVVSVSADEVMYYSWERDSRDFDDFDWGYKGGVDISLKPGTYAVALTGQCHGQDRDGRTYTAVLRPGHRYVTKKAGCFGLNLFKAGLHLWLEDADTGEDVTGSKEILIN